MGAGDLSTTVSIHSRDEYGELGSAFNSMTRALGNQLSLLRVMDEVDQCTLRDQEVESIARAALEGFGKTLPGVVVAVAMLDDLGGQAMTK